MGKHPLYVFGAVLVVLGLVLAGCAKPTPAPTPVPAAAPTPAPTPAKVYKFQFAHFGTPEAGPRWQMALKWAEMVDKETNGQVKIEVFPANTLVKVAETVTALSKGAIDGAFHPDAYLVGIIAPFEWGIMPGLATPETVYDIYYETGLFDMFNERLKEKGIFSAGFYSPGSVDIIVHTKQHILRPEELKGKKMRMWGGTWAEVFKELGTGLVTMPSAEVYIALQRGTVEGAGSAMAAVYGFKWQEIAPYWSYFAKGGMGGPYSVHYTFAKDKWDTLPKELQDKVISAGKKMVPVAMQARAEWDAGLVDKATAEGAKIVVPDPQPWVEQVGPMAKRIYLKRGGALAEEVWNKVEAWHQKTGR